jgi:hypothetical protein
MKKKARVFIGSSREGEDVALDLQRGLERVAYVNVWSQGVFGLGEGNLQALVRAASEVDFAVLVLTPDDLLLKSRQTRAVPRDNVLFELGLFMGVLGQQRTFIVYDRKNPPSLPTDLAGVTAATYEGRGRRGELFAAVGPAYSAIRESIRRLGARMHTSTANISVDLTSASSVLKASAHGFELTTREALAKRSSISDILNECRPNSALLLVGRTCLAWANEYHAVERAINKKHVHIKVAIVTPGLPARRWMILDDFGRGDVKPAVAKFASIRVDAMSRGSFELFYLPSSVLVSFLSYVNIRNQTVGILEVGADLALAGRQTLLLSSPANALSPLLASLQALHNKILAGRTPALSMRAKPRRRARARKKRSKQASLHP